MYWCQEYLFADPGMYFFVLTKMINCSQNFARQKYIFFQCLPTYLDFSNISPKTPIEVHRNISVSWISIHRFREVIFVLAKLINFSQIFAGKNFNFSMLSNLSGFLLIFRRDSNQISPQFISVSNMYSPIPEGDFSFSPNWEKFIRNFRWLKIKFFNTY